MTAQEIKFPDSLKLSDIILVFKKLDPSDKANYRPVNVLPLLSKSFEKINHDQFYENMEKHSTQHVFFRLLKKWQSELDSGGYGGTILLDLSKA